MIGLIRKLFWVVLFVASTFGFVVLFEHGTENFVANAQAEFENLRAFVGTHFDQPGAKKTK